ncbi:MAG: hypothetical protein EOO08_06755 [Chitinophagaceae bacterium]|nr:MAG: hypothetical protein EOO08_06755 [Chitinophagaceae bacterium]
MKTVFFTDRSGVEQNALQSLRAFEEEDAINNIAVFPDIHYCSERSIPVGVAFRATDRFYPLVTGKDTGCGVAYLRFHKRELLRPFDKGAHYRAFERAVHGMTDEGLGGGNHFLSLEESEQYFYIIVHTGSRNLGIHLYQENYALLQQHNSGKEWLPLELANADYLRAYEEVLAYAAARRREFATKSLQFLQRNKYVGEVQTEYADSCHNLLEFGDDGVVHRKGSTQLQPGQPAVLPLSMSRGSLIVQGIARDERLQQALHSCAHGAGRQFSRTDTLKHWHSLKKAEKDAYRRRFPELLNRSGDFDSSILQEFDFAYKDSAQLLATQPYLKKLDQTTPVVTVKFTGV